MIFTHDSSQGENNGKGFGRCSTPSGIKEVSTRYTPMRIESGRLDELSESTVVRSTRRSFDPSDRAHAGLVAEASGRAPELLEERLQIRAELLLAP